MNFGSSGKVNINVNTYGTTGGKKINTTGATHNETADAADTYEGVIAQQIVDIKAGTNKYKTETKDIVEAEKYDWEFKGWKDKHKDSNLETFYKAGGAVTGFFGATNASNKFKSWGESHKAFNDKHDFFKPEGKGDADSKIQNVIYGNPKYKPGGTLKTKKGKDLTNIVIASGALWPATDRSSAWSEIVPESKVHVETDTKVADGSGHVTFGQVDIDDGHVEFNLLQAKGEYESHFDNGKVANDFSVGAEVDIGHAQADGNWELGPGYVKASASAEISVVHVEANIGDTYSIKLPNGENFELVSGSLTGEADALTADAQAALTIGGWPHKVDVKDENGNVVGQEMHFVDAGIKLEANAELVSASGTASFGLLGAKGSITGKVKVGAGVQLNAGFQDGKLQWKLGLAIGIGFEIGGSYDISGLTTNLMNLADNAFPKLMNKVDTFKDDVKEFVSDVWDGFLDLF